MKWKKLYTRSQREVISKHVPFNEDKMQLRPRRR
jgi:hypothetical protein